MRRRTCRVRSAPQLCLARGSGRVMERGQVRQPTSESSSYQRQKAPKMSRLTHAFWMTHGRIKRLAAWPFCPDDAHGRPHTIGVPRPTDSATSLALKCPRRPKNAPQPAHLLLSGRAGPEKLPQLHVLVSRSRHSPWTAPRSPPSPPQLPAEACVCAMHGRVLSKPARELAGARQQQAGSGRVAASHALSL